MSLKKTPIAVFASGRGSNFQSILRSVQLGEIDARIVALVCNDPAARCIEFAEKAGVPVILEDSKKYSDRRSHEIAILKKLQNDPPKFITLAGYFRILSPFFLSQFRDLRGSTRVINIHPSLLPEYPGLGAYEKAFRDQKEVTGVTIHLVEDTLDSGPVCAQESFRISDCRSAEEVEKRGLQVEHRLYPETLKWLLRGDYQVQTESNRRSCVRPS